jgi:outer membrane protein TolC
LLLPALCPAQEASTPALVTEQEFLESLDAGSAPIRALREEVGLARADALGVRALENPRLAAAREAPADAIEQIDLTLAWRPPRPARRRLAIAASDAAITAAESRLEIGEMGIRLAMRDAFARWSVADARATVLADVAERLDVLARSQQRRSDAGEISGLSARRVMAAASSAKAELARARGELATAIQAALVWRPDLDGAARPVLPELPAALPQQRTSPQVSALEADAAAARLERDLAARVVQMPELVAGWQRQNGDAGDVAEGPILGLEWPLPLLDRARAERARAEVRLDAVEARLEVARRTFAAQSRGALAAYEVLRTAALDAAKATADTEPMVEAATTSFRLGEATVTDLLDTLRAAVDAELHALDLRSAALEAHRELERLAGVAPGGVDRGGDAPTDPSRPTTDEEQEHALDR